MAPRNGWNSYQKLVLNRLDDHSKALEDLNKEVQSIRVTDIPSLQVEIAMLKIKAGAWGAVAGGIPGILAVAYVWMSK
jgi:hypothetical protein